METKKYSIEELNEFRNRCYQNIDHFRHLEWKLSTSFQDIINKLYWMADCFQNDINNYYN